MATAPTFFAKPADFRRWLAAHHETAPELIVGFWKKAAGTPSIGWPEARDQALCFGWIDGIRKSLGEDSYTIRFTPRRKGSIWSKVNVERFHTLKAEGAMTEAGERAFEPTARTRHIILTRAWRAPSRRRTSPGSGRTRRPGPIGSSARPATARSCCTGSPAPRSPRPARGGWPP